MRSSAGASLLLLGLGRRSSNRDRQSGNAQPVSEMSVVVHLATFVALPLVHTLVYATHTLPVMVRPIGEPPPV